MGMQTVIKESLSRDFENLLSTREACHTCAGAKLVHIGMFKAQTPLYAPFALETEPVKDP